MSWPSDQREPRARPSLWPLNCSTDTRPPASDPGWVKQERHLPKASGTPTHTPYLCGSRCQRYRRCKCCRAPRWTPISWPISPQGHQLRVEFATWMWTEDVNGTSKKMAQGHLQNLKTIVSEMEEISKFPFFKCLNGKKEKEKKKTLK